VKEDAARRKEQAIAAARGTTLHLGGAPVADCVISRGWRERGLAHILVARELPNGKLVAAGFFVDGRITRRA
jgi:hypothetical protein